MERTTFSPQNPTALIVLGLAMFFAYAGFYFTASETTQNFIEAGVFLILASCCAFLGKGSKDKWARRMYWVASFANLWSCAMTVVSLVL